MVVVLVVEDPGGKQERAGMNDDAAAAACAAVGLFLRRAPRSEKLGPSSFKASAFLRIETRGSPQDWVGLRPV